MTQKVQCWDVTFLPITQGWTDSINPWTKLVCYWHILTQNYQAWVFSQTVFIAHTRTHTLSHSRIVRFVGWARCEDKMLNILAAGELHYWNVLRQHIQDDDGGGVRKHTHTLWLYSCRGSSKRAAPAPVRQRPRTDALTLQLATQPAHQCGDSLSTSDSFHLVFLNAYSYRNHQVRRVKDEQNVDRKLSCETVSKPLTLQIRC